jgi:hypothetical protein
VHYAIAESGECCATIFVEDAAANSFSKNNTNTEEFTAKIGGASTTTVKMGKKTPKHVCNSDTLASIEAVSSEAKPCPKCHAFISKVSGCDQMFCTKCYTTYSWCTGEIAPENSFRHNPHYLDWVRSTQYAGATHKNSNANYNDWNRDNVATNRMSQRQDIINTRRLQAADRYAQGAFLQVTHDHRGELDLGRVFSCSIKRRFPFSNPATRYNPLSCEEHYGFIFLAMHRHILDIRANSGNHANARPVDNHDLRVRFIANEISEEEFKNLIAMRDFEYKRLCEYRDVYLGVFDVAPGLFENLFKIVHNKKEYPFYKTYVQLQKLLQSANEALERLNRIYGNDKRFVNYQQF